MVIDSRSIWHATAKTVLLAIVSALPGLCMAQPAIVTLNIQLDKPLHAVSPTLYGLMTEEINHSYDGGLYAQMLSNHVFRTNWAGVESWGLVRNGNAKAAADIDKTTGPSAALPTRPEMRTPAVMPTNARRNRPFTRSQPPTVSVPSLTEGATLLRNERPDTQVRQDGAADGAVADAQRSRRRTG